MVRDTFSLIACAGLILGGAALLCAGPDDNADKIATTLRVQTALAKGRDSLKSGHYREAVDFLEKEIALIEGDTAYLNMLRDSYLGLIGELTQKNQADEVSHYRRRLVAIDPGAQLELKTPAQPSPAPVPATPVSATPPVPAPANPTPAPVTKRDPVTPEIDPFSDANAAASAQTQAAASSPQTQALLAQAETAFAAGKYEVASRLFEQLSKADASAVKPAQERWAYCKMYVVGRQLGDAGAKPHVLEREVRLAMSMARHLEPTGQQLLRKIKERQGSASADNSERTDEPLTSGEVRHLPRDGDGWAVAESTNFRILHTQPTEMAERVARAAEAARLASARKWFGDVTPSWPAKCDVYLHLTREAYSKQTGQPADCPGHSSISTEGARVVKRRIDLHVDDPNMIIGVIPHETTHVVLADRFGGQPLPRWADEGMAVLSEPRDRVERHLRNLPQHQRDHQLFEVGRLMRFNDYPEGKYIGAFYAESVSLVDYLSRQPNGPQGFTKFLTEGMRTGFEPALQQHYGFRSFLDFQQRWQADTLSNGKESVAARKP